MKTKRVRIINMIALAFLLLMVTYLTTVCAFAESKNGQWVDVNSESDFGNLSSGRYYLTSGDYSLCTDIVLTHNIIVESGTVNLLLNGYKLSRVSVSVGVNYFDNYIICVKEGATLNVLEGNKKNGSVCNESTLDKYKCAIYNTGGTINVNGHIYSDENGTDSYAIISEGGKVNINEGSLVEGGCCGLSSEGGIVNISGGTITGRCAVGFTTTNDSALQITGGNFEGKTYGVNVSYAYGTNIPAFVAEIKDGYFSASEGPCVGTGYGTMMISGGRFKNDLSVWATNTKIIVKGGIFGSNQVKDYCHKDYEVVSNSDIEFPYAVVEKPTFLVSFEDGFGDLIKTETVHRGDAAAAPENPSHQCCLFKGWDKEFDNITANLVVTALWDKNKHTWNTTYTTDLSATCTTEGRESIHCCYCNEIKEGSSRAIPKTAHNYGDWQVIEDATCTNKGSKYRVCADCGYEIYGEIPIAAHNYGDWQIIEDATCVDKGSRYKECKICGDKISGEIPLTAHNYGDWVTTKQATEVEAGQQTRTCSYCGKMETKIIAKLQPTEKLFSDLKAVKISKLKASKKAATVKWKKVSKKYQKKIQGIEIQVSTDPVFQNIVKRTTVGKKSTSKKIKGLKSKTKYWVRIRVYRNDTAGKHVSAWKTKMVKVK